MMGWRDRDEELLGGVIFIIVVWAIILLAGAFMLGGCAVKRAVSENKNSTVIDVTRAFHMAIRADECESWELELNKSSGAHKDTDKDKTGDVKALNLDPSKLKGGVK